MAGRFVPEVPAGLVFAARRGYVGLTDKNIQRGKRAPLRKIGEASRDPVIKTPGFNAVWVGIIQGVCGEPAFILSPEGFDLFVIRETGKASGAEVSRGRILCLDIMGCCSCAGF